MLCLPVKFRIWLSVEFKRGSFACTIRCVSTCTHAEASLGQGTPLPTMCGGICRSYQCICWNTIYFIRSYESMTADPSFKLQYTVRLACRRNDIYSTIYGLKTLKWHWHGIRTKCSGWQNIAFSLFPTETRNLSLFYVVIYTLDWWSISLLSS